MLFAVPVWDNAIIQAMTDTFSARRIVENEVFFREHNEQVQKGFDELSSIVAEVGEPKYAYDTKTPLHFYCECADEDCRERIRLNLETYRAIHANRRAFTIVCGHEVKEVERIIEKTSDYCIVEKYTEPPRSSKELHSTNLNKS